MSQTISSEKSIHSIPALSIIPVTETSKLSALARRWLATSDSTELGIGPTARYDTIRYDRRV